MATATINGRKVELPASSSDLQIRELGRINPDRNVIRSNRWGNYLIPRGTVVEVSDGDRFIDAPARRKGSRGK